MKRTHTNGALRIADVEAKVTLLGWVAKRRNFGALVFIDLRDREGITQLVFDETISPQLQNVRNEYILQVEGIVEERKDKNPKLKTGDIEVRVSAVEILNTAHTTPLIIADETDALEDTRLKYRYLDLRRPMMQEKLKMRHKIVKTMRAYLDDLGFIEIETPILGKSTPEGARDYLVPSRVHPGSFYALPQSPQLFKQLLMISGFERYYQVAKCFRDEDLRADRQPDFTQFDIETSFLTQKEICTMMEDMMAAVMKEVKGIEINTPFLRISYQEAMNRYGSDKPDNRFALELQDIADVFKNSEFKVFKECLQKKGSIKCIVVEKQASYSRKEIDKLNEIAKRYGAKGLVSLKYLDRQLEGSVVKFFSEEEQANLIKTLQLKEDDLILISSDTWECVCEVLGALRLHFAKTLQLTNKQTFSFLWVDDFPMFEFDAEDNRYYAKHHPFTKPREQDLHLLDSDPSKMLSAAYDMVLNGYELGGGSLRIYDNTLQAKIFETLGFTKAEIQERFGFFIDAFQYGTPPHGGIAFGLDRIAMILSESDSIRDVIAFPKNASAKDPLSDAPSRVDEMQLDELNIVIK
ncbi:MAG: aspartate--tRNA ligase [Breznakia sp.]